MRGATGFSLAESVLVLALCGLSLLTVWPALGRMRAAAMSAAGARHIAVLVQALRFKSAADGASRGLRFAHDERGWWWVEVRDGNGNGIRSAEVANGIDPTVGAPDRLERVVAGITVGFPPGGSFPKIPPGQGTIADLEDPVQLGSADILSVSPLGTATGGTIYVTDRHDRLFAVVVYGATGRVRVWRYDAEGQVWAL